MHCSQSFNAKTGLSQHERHRHPVVRNMGRIRAEEKTGKPGRMVSVWTEEDVALLKQMEGRYKDERFINIKIQEHMPGKTTKQIGDKRRALRVQQDRPQVELAIRMEEIGEVEAQAQEEEAKHENEEWKQILLEEAKKRPPNTGEFNEINSELAQIASGHADLNTLDEALDQLV